MKINFYLRVIATMNLLSLVACNSETNFSGGNKNSFDQKSSQIFSFHASEIVDGKTTIADGGRFAAYEVKQTEKPANKVIHKQIKRSKFSDSFKQGHSSKFSQEEFQLSEAGMLDFLIVVDNSKSMSDEQAMVGKGLVPLISEFKETNWQIAVISMSNPCVSTSNLIKKTDANVEKKFENAVKMPFDNSAMEQGFPMAIQALKGQCNGSMRSWLREGSTLGVLFLSDEDNCGSDSGELARCNNLLGKNASEMVDFLRSIRPAAEARVYGIVDKDGTCRDAAGIGAMYVEAANATGGSIGSICHDYTNASGYGTYLESVSTDVNKILKRHFTLSSVPDLTRFEVSVDGAPVESGGVVKIQGKTVYIDPKIITSGLKIKFSYTHDAVPMFSEIPVSTTPVLSSIDLKVNGARLQEGKDFHFVPDRRVLAFVTSPPEDAEVSVSYLEDVTLKTKFKADFVGVRRETVHITINGMVVQPSEYSLEDDGVLLPTAPTDGAIIAVEWKNEGHKNLKYPMKISDSREAIAWKVKNQATGEEIPATWNKLELEFESANVEEGRIVGLFVDFGEKSPSRIFEIPHERVDDVVAVLADGVEGICEMRNSNVEIDVTDRKSEKNEENNRYKGKQVHVICKEGADYKTLELRYHHEINRTQVFEVNLPRDVDPEDAKLGWLVHVDGVKIREFTRKGREITIEETMLPPGARIDVEVITYEKVER